MTTKHFRNGGIAVDRSDPAIVTENKTGRATAPRIVGLRHVGMVAFLSGDPAEESHQIAIFTNPALRHIAFKVGTLADLRAAYTRIIDMGLPIKMAFNHGVSLAFYFDDPEGNLVEVYWATGMAFDQPYGDTLDLALPEEALRQEVEQLVRQASEQTPQSLPVASAS
jgi:catechol-2,3-dioxygenase